MKTNRKYEPIVLTTLMRIGDEVVSTGEDGGWMA